MDDLLLAPGQRNAVVVGKLTTGRKQTLKTQLIGIKSDGLKQKQNLGGVMTEQVKDKATVDLTFWECGRIVLALLNANNSMIGTYDTITMRDLYNKQAELLRRIDKAAASILDVQINLYGEKR